MKRTPDLTVQIPPDRCDRCGGLMVSEWVGDLGVECENWRCVICGERIDPVVIAHRREMAATAYVNKAGGLFKRSTFC